MGVDVDVDDGTRIEHIDRLKSVIGTEINAGKQGGTLACPNCPYDRDWRTGSGGWVFSQNECNVRVDGRLSRKRLAHWRWKSVPLGAR